MSQLDPATGGGGRALGGWAAARIQARWTVRRLLRGRMLWVSAMFAMGPILFALLTAQSGHGSHWDELFATLVLLCGIVPPLFIASTLAEEIEDRTYTYLWSRPLPRWSVLVGKVLATVPVVAVLLGVTALLCYQLAYRAMPSGNPWPEAAAGRAVGAMALAGMSLSIASAGLAVLVPRHGIGVAYAYILVLDMPLGVMPFSIANLSMTHHIATVGGVREHDPTASTAVAIAWLCGLAAVWLVVGLWRIGRSEFATGEK